MGDHTSGMGEQLQAWAADTGSFAVYGNAVVRVRPDTATDVPETAIDPLADELPGSFEDMGTPDYDHLAIQQKGTSKAQLYIQGLVVKNAAVVHLHTVRQRIPGHRRR